MRPLIAMGLTLAMFAGVYGYTRFVESVRIPPLEIKPQFASGEFAVRISRTFDCVGDPDFNVESLLVKFRGAEVYKRSNTISRNELIEIRPLENVEQRKNEVFVSANVSQEDDDWDVPESTTVHAMRIEVLKGDRTIADATFWQEPGTDSIVGTVQFETAVEKTSAPH